MGPIDQLTSQLEEVDADPRLDAGAKVAALTDLRDRANEVVGQADRLIAGQQRAREATAVRARQDRHIARENADLAEADGGDDLEPAGLLGHGELDRLAEEGLEAEAVEELSSELGFRDLR